MVSVSRVHGLGVIDLGVINPGVINPSTAVSLIPCPESRVVKPVS